MSEVEQIARVAHEVNRAYCEALGDTSQTAWDEAPKWQKDSAVIGVKAHLENPAWSPRESHELWVKTKMAEGWVYGPVKNPARKEHPCMVGYFELPIAQRAKDYIFKAVVGELAGFRKACSADETQAVIETFREPPTTPPQDDEKTLPEPVHTDYTDEELAVPLEEKEEVNESERRDTEDSPEVGEERSEPEPERSETTERASEGDVRQDG